MNIPNLMAFKEANEKLCKREFIDQKGYVVSYPQRIWLESSTRCNFKCLMCSVTYGDSAGEDMSLNVFKLLEKTVLPTLRFIDMQGQGEPLLSENFDLFYQSCIRNRVQPCFVTNGSMLTKDRMRRFVKDGALLHISMDGITSDVYSQLRPQGNVEKLIEKIKFMSGMKQAYPGSIFSLGIIFIATRNNITQLPELVKKCGEWKVNQIWVHKLDVTHVPNQELKKMIVNIDEQPELSQYFSLSKAIAKDIGISLNLPLEYHNENGVVVQLPENLKSIAEKRGSSKYPGVCCVPWINAYIAVNGDVRPCCASFEVAGNLSGQTFMEIWNSSLFIDYRKRVNTNNPPEACKKCWVHFGINMGSPA